MGTKAKPPIITKTADLIISGSQGLMADPCSASALMKSNKIFLSRIINYYTKVWPVALRLQWA